MKYMMFLLLPILLLACNPTVVFREPQPEGKKDMESFPVRHQGSYLEVDDSSIYIISTNIIYEKHEDTIAEHESAFLEDTNLYFIGDSLIYRDENIVFKVKRRNDSVFGTYVYYDTVFNIEGEDRLRKLGKNYFLNLPSDSLWMVLKLSFNKCGAFLCDVNHEKEVKIFQENCGVEIITDKEGKPKKYIMSPSSKELKSLLKLGAFSDTSEYIRLTENEVPGFMMKGKH